MLTKVSGIVKSSGKEPIYRRKSNLSASEWKEFNEELGTILNEKLSNQNEAHNATFIG